VTVDFRRFLQYCTKQVIRKVIWEERVGLAQLRNKVPVVTMGRPQFHPKTSLSLRRSPPLSNTPIPRPTPLTIPTTSGSDQPFCHSTLSGQTDRQTHRQTDRWARRQVSKISAYAHLIESDALTVHYALYGRIIKLCCHPSVCLSLQSPVPFQTHSIGDCTACPRLNAIGGGISPRRTTIPWICLNSSSQKYGSRLLLFLPS